MGIRSTDDVGLKAGEMWVAPGTGGWRGWVPAIVSVFPDRALSPICGPRPAFEPRIVRAWPDVCGPTRAVGHARPLQAARFPTGRR
jgi:hypothetical protein